VLAAHQSSSKRSERLPAPIHSFKSLMGAKSCTAKLLLLGCESKGVNAMGIGRAEWLYGSSFLGPA